MDLATENRSFQVLTTATACRYCGQLFEEHRTGPGVVFLLCGCKNVELGEFYKLKLGEVDRPEVWHPDANFRCSPTSPGILTALLGGDISPRNFFDLTNTGSEFHFYKYRDGRATVYEGHCDSVTFGWAQHQARTHDHHLTKSSNANLIQATYSASGSAVL